MAAASSSARRQLPRITRARLIAATVALLAWTVVAGSGWDTDGRRWEPDGTTTATTIHSGRA
jgi:hypothetical protein